MTLDHRVRERLLAIEALLRETEHWQDSAPDSRAFASEQPFCLDTMEPLEWLQWVLIPRMRQLLESGMPLPQNFAVAPYYAAERARPDRPACVHRSPPRQADVRRAADGAIERSGKIAVAAVRAASNAETLPCDRSRLVERRSGA